MEIKYLPALVEPKAVEFNFEEIKAELLENLDKYKNLVVTEDSIQDAKKTKAKLNHFKTMVDEERKRVKRIYEEPYRAIEPKFKELYNLIDEPVLAIDEQIKSFELIELNKKQEQIKEIYSKNIGIFEAIVPLDKIYQKQWDNKTVSLKKIEAEMTEKINKIASDLDVIKNFNSEFETELRASYLETFNFGDVIYKKQKLEEHKKFVESEKEKEKYLHKQIEPKYKKETIYTRKFYVKATKEQLIELSEFLKLNNIVFGPVD